MTDTSTDTIQTDAARFDAALLRLETALAASVQKIADMARRTGFEDGVAHAASQTEDHTSSNHTLMPDLQNELDAAKMREASLQEAVHAARAALDEAMDDIRSALGPL